LVKEGRAAGFITAGNTGAAMATAKMVLAPAQSGPPSTRRRLPDIQRDRCVVVDVGANVDASPPPRTVRRMGEIYSADLRHTSREWVCFVGEEESKGMS